MRRLPLFILAALAALGATASAARDYINGDLLLGFHATDNPGATTNFVVNLGSAAQCTGATSAFTVPVGSLGTDLAAYSESGGDAWHQRADLFWGIIGTDLAADPANTIYVTKPRSAPATPTEAWPRRSFITQSATNSTVRSFVSGFKASEANATAATGTLQTSTQINSYGQFTAGSDFGSYPEIEGSFAGGAANSVLDLYRLTPTTQNAQGPGRILIGSFQLDASGALTFTPAAATSPNFAFATNRFAADEDDGTVTVTIVRGAVTSGAASVQISTNNGSAVAGTDFTGITSQTVNFAADQTTATVPITIINRPNVQPSRDFTVTLSSPSAGSVELPSSATISINDTSPADFGAITFSAPTYMSPPTNAGGQPAAIPVTITRSGGDGAVSATLSVAAGGSLVSPADFTLSTTNVQFAEGVTQAVVTVQLAALADGKLPGTINLSLSDAQGGATIGTQATATVTVTARDKAKPTLKITTKAGAVNSPTFTINGTTKDNSDVARVEVVVSGGAPVQATLGAPSTNGTRTVSLGNIALENGLNTIVVTSYDSSGNASKSVTLKVRYNNNRPALAGAYNGLLTAAAAPANNTTGFIKANVTPLGVITGTALIGKDSVTVRGLIDNAGVARFNVTGDTAAAPTKLLLAKKTGQVTTTYGDLALTFGANKFLGTLKDSGAVTLANVDADKAGFNGKPTGTSVPAQYLLNGGKYTVLFPARAAYPGLTAADYPQGDGAGTITITKAGVVKIVANLADGSVVSGSATLSSSLRWPLFAKLYAKLGFLSGFVQLDDQQADSDLKGADLLWFRPANALTTHYVAGWPQGLAIDLLGAKYSATTFLPGLDAVNAQNGNATLQFTDGKLVAFPPLRVSIAANGKATNSPASPDYNLKLVKATGVFSGKFKHQDGTKPAYKGAIYQKGAAQGGFGLFLSTVPRNSATPGEGGAVTLIAD